MGKKLRFRHLPCSCRSPHHMTLHDPMLKDCSRSFPFFLKEKKLYFPWKWKHTFRRILVFSRSTLGKDTIVRL